METTPTSRPTEDTPPPGLADLPNYEIKRELGRSARGVVYLAHNNALGRDEVLKVPGRQIIERPGVLDRLLREIRAVATLRHPNIATAYSATRFGESIVFAMEYVDGLDLAELVRAKGPLPVTHACKFVYQAAPGLQRAHEEGLVHGEIKPSNLMLSRTGENETVKVLDFGLATATREQRVDSSLTWEGQALGTPEFLAPEQIVDATGADIRADIYSLGATLYYLLAGRPPFQANSLYAMYQAHCSHDADPLNLVRPEVPAELAALVAKMMAKDPARRFLTPAEVARAIVPFFTGGSPTISDELRLREDPDSARKPDRGVAKRPYVAPLVVGDDPDARWATIASELAAYRDEQRRAWGELDDLAIARFIAGESTREEAVVVQRTIADHPKLRECVEVLRDVLGLESPSSAKEGSSPRTFGIPVTADETARKWLHPHAMIAIAASVLLGSALILSGLRIRRDRELVGIITEPDAATASVTLQASKVAIPQSVTAPLGSDDGKFVTGSQSNSVEGMSPRLVTPSNPPVNRIAQGEASNPGSRASRGLLPPEQKSYAARVPTPSPGMTGSPQLKLAQGIVPLEKLLKSPEFYANQRVVLSRAYCIGDVCSQLPDGRVVLPVIESILDLKGSGSRRSIVTRRAKSFDLEIDPKLVERLVSARLLAQVSGSLDAKPIWGDNVAIVTMAVTSRSGNSATAWAPRIEKFEFLTDMRPQRVTIAPTHKYKVAYKTLTVTANFEEPGEGNAEDWAQPERLLHIANQFKDLIDNPARNLSDAEWQRLNNTNTVTDSGLAKWIFRKNRSISP